MWAELPFGPWTPRRGRSYKQHKEKMKSERRLLRQVLEALENQAACGKGAVFAHPASSYVWETPSVQKWESLSEHQVLYYKNAREDTKMKAILSGCAPPPGGDSGELTAEEVFAKALQETGKRKRKGYHEAWAVEAEPPNIDEEPGDEPELREAGAKCITFDQRVPKAVQGALRKLHQNLGHPPNSELARHIRLSGGSSEAVKACKTLRMVDYASTFHVVVAVKDRTAKTLAETVRDHWVSWAGPPHTFALDLDSGFKSVFDEMCYEFGSFMSHAAGTAHWQHGLVERHNGAWKSIWERTVDSAMVVEHEVAWTIAEVSNAKNQLRNKDGHSPRQWVFGANPRLPGDVFDDENNLAAMSHYTVDARMQRQNAIRQAARIAFMRVQTDQAMQRALLHRSRVKKTHYEPGDLVFIFRQKKPERDKKPVKMWVGPCTVIGNEGQNLWVSKGGRCLLCAPEHLRPAEAEEISELLRVRAAMDDVQAIIDEDKALRAAFAPEDEELIPDDGGNQAEGKDTDDIAEELLTGEGEAFQEKFVEMENMDWDDGAERRRRCLDDLPHWHSEEEKANAEQPMAQEVLFGKVASTQGSAFLEAEQKQWSEHLKFEAVRVLTKEETEQVYAEVPPERILNSRFAYKDKARAQRAQHPDLPVRAKARLCIGGHRDPDLGVRQLSVDAPTACKDSLMLGMQCAVSHRWSASIGDVQAAFLNGVAAPRGLFFKQPPRGLPGVEEGVLVEIIKGVFGLSTSPRLWFEKLVPKGANQEQVDDRLFHDNRTAVGCLSWLAKESRPDLACAANFAQARQGSPTIADIKDTNKAIKQAKDYKENGIKIKPIPLHEMCLVVYHDAAWGNSEPEDEAVAHLVGHRVGSQIGYLVLAVHNSGIGGRPCAMSTLAWKSHSCKRVCRSTFAGETMACCEGVECAIHLRARLLSLMLRKLIKEPEAAEMVPIHAVTDCKSLFDFVHRCGTPKPTADRRLIIDLASLKQIFLNEAKGWWKRERGDETPAVDDPLLFPFHWVPSGHQLSDIMTKQMKPEAWWSAVAGEFFLAVTRQHKREM
ncbi:HSP90 [Symbiodinium sp. KB8]|nr:HSP90 [Symbiodinium sp. KB8]